MPRPRTPLAKAKLTGADAKHPDRFRDRSEPVTKGRPVGNPPGYMNKEAATAWRELARTLGWLEVEDRGAVEVAALAIGQVRTMHKVGEPVTAALFSAMNTALGKLGATPADRSKVSTGAPEDDDDPFAQFDRSRRYFT